MSVKSVRAGEACESVAPKSCQPTGMGIAPVVETGDGEIDVIPETDVTAKTVLGEPEKGSADQSGLPDIGGLLGAGNDCCSGSEES